MFTFRSPIDASACTRLSDRNAAQVGQSRGEALPHPSGEIFAGGIFQTGYVVKVPMVKLVMQWSKRSLDVAKVH